MFANVFTLHPRFIEDMQKVFTLSKEFETYNMNAACPLFIFMFLFFQNSANNNDNDVDNSTNNKITFVMAPITRNHHLNMNLIYRMMEVMCWHNHSISLFVVWEEFMVVGFVDVGELVLVAIELMLFQE